MALILHEPKGSVDLFSKSIPSISNVYFVEFIMRLVGVHKVDGTVTKYVLFVRTLYRLYGISEFTSAFVGVTSWYATSLRFTLLKYTSSIKTILAPA